MAKETKIIKYKNIWRLSKTIALYTSIFWLIETIFFLIKDGWHLKAINEWEKTCDTIVKHSFNIVFVLFFISVINVIEHLFETED
jgi:hypothetical protein